MNTLKYEMKLIDCKRDYCLSQIKKCQIKVNELDKEKVKLWRKYGVISDKKTV